jgi:hypothetical protein
LIIRMQVSYYETSLIGGGTKNRKLNPLTLFGLITMATEALMLKSIGITNKHRLVGGDR